MEENNVYIGIAPLFLFLLYNSMKREIWLSPVIQATWEARAVGWFEVERSI
jgi:hypothetical protein